MWLLVANFAQCSELSQERSLNYALNVRQIQFKEYNVRVRAAADGAVAGCDCTGTTAEL